VVSDDGVRMLAPPGQARLGLIDHHGSGGRSPLYYAIKRNLANTRCRRLEISLQSVDEFFSSDGQTRRKRITSCLPTIQTLGYETQRSIFSMICVLSYSSRKVFAGSIPAIRRVGTVEAMSVTDASVKTTVRIVGRS
jgi:hypothetical protein